MSPKTAPSHTVPRERLKLNSLAQHFNVSVGNIWHQTRWQDCWGFWEGVQQSWQETSPVALCFFSISLVRRLLPLRPGDRWRFKWAVRRNPGGVAGARSGFIISQHLRPITGLAPAVTNLSARLCAPSVLKGVCVITLSHHFLHLLPRYQIFRC